jgi:predicted TIM-barrel fold metal-dependent hydrolase
MNTAIPPIISVDDHVIEPADLWTKWLPGKYRQDGPRVENRPYEMVDPNDPSIPPAQRHFPCRPASSGPSTDFWLYDGLCIPVAHASTASVGLTPDQIDLNTPIGYSAMRPGFYNPAARLADMDVNHIERSLCFPTFPRFCGQRFLEAKDKELALACVRAYNDWMVEEWCGDSCGRLLPLPLIPLWDPEEGAREVLRNAARGVKAVAFSEIPAHLGLPSIHDKDRFWEPFFQACEDTGTVICMHIGSSSKFIKSSDDAPDGVLLSTMTTNSMISMADWLLSGVLARMPKLKLAYSESQIGWMPFLLGRVDTLWRKGNKLNEFPPEITELPSTYIVGRVYGCVFEDDFGLKVRHDVGIDQITFESDYPHQDTTWPNTAAYAEKVMSGFPPDEIYKIVRGNAIQMLELPEELPAG